jgi:hypothetical protein
MFALGNLACRNADMTQKSFPFEEKVIYGLQVGSVEDRDGNQWVITNMSEYFPPTLVAWNMQYNGCN